MPRQKHDPGEIKRAKHRRPLSAEKLRRLRRARALPRLYPGWVEDKRPIRDVKAYLKALPERKAE